MAVEREEIMFSKPLIELSGEAFNFGPRNDQNKTVLALASDLAEYMQPDILEPVKVTDNIPFHEAGLLKLNLRL